MRGELGQSAKVVWVTKNKSFFRPVDLLMIPKVYGVTHQIIIFSKQRYRALFNKGKSRFNGHEE